MSNKKAGIAADEIRGILTFMFVAVIALLIFYSCSANKAAKEYKELKLSKEGIEADKAFNFFLEKPFDEERKVSDVFLEAYLKNDYSEIEKICIKEYFSNIYLNWELYITYHYPKEDWADRGEDSKTLTYVSGFSSGSPTMSFTILPILKESGDMGSIDIALVTHYIESYNT